MSVILKAENLNKTFSSHQALKNVSVSVSKGEIFGLLGPNGAGKTTLIRIINGILKPDSGTVLFNGKPLTENFHHKIGYLPEERGLYKKMKVGEQLTYLAGLKGLDKKTAQERITFWMEKLEIQHWKNKTIEELSKGMAQKVQFVLTVIHQPELLILDEPFSGFDPINAELIKNEIIELKNNGVSIILSTHNMNSVEELCSEIMLMNKGENILSGKVEDIKKQFYQNEYEVVFEGNMISFTTALWTGFELVSHEQIGKNKIKAVVKSIGNLAINELLAVLLSSCRILSVGEVLPSMNDIFIQQIQAQSVTH